MPPATAHGAPQPQQPEPSLENAKATLEGLFKAQRAMPQRSDARACASALRQSTTAFCVTVMAHAGTTRDPGLLQVGSGLLPQHDHHHNLRHHRPDAEHAPLVALYKRPRAARGDSGSFGEHNPVAGGDGGGAATNSFMAQHQHRANLPPALQLVAGPSLGVARAAAATARERAARHAAQALIHALSVAIACGVTLNDEDRLGFPSVPVPLVASSSSIDLCGDDVAGDASSNTPSVHSCSPMVPPRSQGCVSAFLASLGTVGRDRSTPLGPPTPFGPPTPLGAAEIAAMMSTSVNHTNHLLNQHDDGDAHHGSGHTNQHAAVRHRAGAATATAKSSRRPRGGSTRSQPRSERHATATRLRADSLADARNQSTATVPPPPPTVLPPPSSVPPLPSSATDSRGSASGRTSTATSRAVTPSSNLQPFVNFTQSLNGTPRKLEYGAIVANESAPASDSESFTVTPHFCNRAGPTFADYIGGGHGQGQGSGHHDRASSHFHPRPNLPQFPSEGALSDLHMIHTESQYNSQTTTPTNGVTAYGMMSLHAAAVAARVSPYRAVPDRSGSSASDLSSLAHMQRLPPLGQHSPQPSQQRQFPLMPLHMHGVPVVDSSGPTPFSSVRSGASPANGAGGSSDPVAGGSMSFADTSSASVPSHGPW